MNACLWAERPEYAEISCGEPSRYDPSQGQRGKVIFSVTLGSTIQMSSKQTPGILDLNSIRHETNIPSRLVPVLELNKEPQILVWSVASPVNSRKGKWWWEGSSISYQRNPPRHKQSTISGAGRIPVATSVPKLGWEELQRTCISTVFTWCPREARVKFFI